MKRNILILTMVLFLGACSTTGAKSMKINAQDAKAKMDASMGFVLLDVRTPEEFNDERIPGAINLPLDEIGESTLALLKDLDQEIYVYCRSGNRSAQAATKLVGLGYTKVYDFGGIIDWPYETE
ncbi:MAG: rhodanese-like domain-containing protein [Erysipelotrichaceae bacterium]